MTRRTLCFVAILSLLLALIGTAAAAADAGTVCNGITIVQDVPAAAATGDRVTLSFTITNNGPGQRQVTLEQGIPGGVDFDTTASVRKEAVHTGTGYVCFGPNCTSQPPEGGLSSISIDTNSYRWTVTASPGESKQVSSWIIPRTAGDLWLQPPAVAIGTESCILPARSVIVACAGGHNCDPAQGENYLTCPANCRNWSADNVCNPVQDGQCDPDCRAGTDPDCSSSTRPATATQTPLPTGITVSAVAAGAALLLFLRRKGE